MKIIRAEIEIRAVADHVWQLVTDFASYPQWNPFIRRVKGELRRGARLEVSLQPPGVGLLTLQPVVVKNEPNSELSWFSCFWLPWLLQGEHRFTIRRMGPELVQFTHFAIYKGLFTPLFFRNLEKPMRQGAELMNMMLKLWAERTQMQFMYC